MEFDDVVGLMLVCSVIVLACVIRSSVVEITARLDGYQGDLLRVERLCKKIAKVELCRMRSVLTTLVVGRAHFVDGLASAVPADKRNLHREICPKLGVALAQK